MDSSFFTLECLISPLRRHVLFSLVQVHHVFQEKKKKKKRRLKQKKRFILSLTRQE